MATFELSVQTTQGQATTTSCALPQDLLAYFEPCVVAAQGKWPEVQVQLADFVAFVTDRCEHARPRADISALHITDLYLAHACLAGDVAAMRCFERTFFSELPTLLRRSALGNLVSEDELAQTLRQLLFLRDPSRTTPAPKLSRYRGKGTLKAWFRVTALRAASNLARQRRRSAVALDDDIVGEFLTAGQDPELDYFKQLYSEDFRSVFADAIADLGVRERNLLRLHYVNGASLEALATMHQVHYSTTSRWLTKIRATLARSVTRGLIARLGFRGAELQSVVRLVRSQLNLSIARQLA